MAATGAFASASREAPAASRPHGCTASSRQPSRTRHARQQAVLGEAARRLLDEPLLLGEGEREAHAGFLGGSETRSVPCATQASWSPFVTSTRTTAVRRPSATTVDSATTVPARTGAR